MRIIKLSVPSADDLFNTLDPEASELNSDVKSYILEKMKNNDSDFQYEVHILSEDEIDETRVQESVRSWIDQELHDIKAEQRRNATQQAYLFLVGIMFIAISLALESRVSAVWFTVLSTIGSFSIWEATSIWIVENPKLRIRKRVIGKLLRSTKVRVLPKATQ